MGVERRDELCREIEDVLGQVRELRAKLRAERVDLPDPDHPGRHRRPQLRLIKGGLLAAPLVALGWLRDQKVAVAASTAVAGVLSVPMALSPSTGPPLLPADAAPPPTLGTPQFNGQNIEQPRYGLPPPVDAATGRGLPTPRTSPAPTTTPTASAAGAEPVGTVTVTVTVEATPSPTAAVTPTPAPVPLSRPEARQVCLDQGVLPVDLGACIAELVGG